MVETQNRNNNKLRYGSWGYIIKLTKGSNQTKCRPSDSGARKWQ